MYIAWNILLLTALTFISGIEGTFRGSGITDQIYFSKAPRFIKFDSKDDEVEIELGVSIPVVKLPLAPKVGRHGGEKETGITVSAPGLVVAGVLVLTTFLVVPLLFSTKTENVFRTGKTGEPDVWNVLRDIQKDLRDGFLQSPSCVESVVCWATKVSKTGEDGSIGKWIDTFLRNKWIEKLVRGTSVEEAILTGRSDSECWEKYRNCQLLRKSEKRKH